MTHPGVEIRQSVIYEDGGFCFAPMTRGLQIGGRLTRREAELQACGDYSRESEGNPARTALKQPLLIIWDGARPHRAAMVREYLDSLKGHIHMTFLPPYCP